MSVMKVKCKLKKIGGKKNAKKVIKNKIKIKKKIGCHVSIFQRQSLIVEERGNYSTSFLLLF